MFLLASDFDRTFYINNYDFKKNVELLNSFMKKNLFVIVTGRSYQDYMNITKNSVPVNYLVLNHGATIIKDDEVIRSISIDNKTKDKLREIIDFDKTEYFATKDKESRVSIDCDNLSKINVTMQDNLVAKRAVDYINSNFDDIKAYVLFHKNQFEIISTKANKYYAIDYISSIENIDKNNVYTVGDGYTDIKMVEYYQGYAIKDSIADLKEVAISTVDSVSDIFKLLDVDINLEKTTSNLISFINECYNYDHYFEEYMAKIYKNYNNTLNHVVIRKNNDIIACALIHPNKLFIGDSYLDILTIGSICVKEKYRKKGYLKMLMSVIKEEGKKYDLSVLSGDIKRYAKYDFYPNILTLYKVSSKKNNGIHFRSVTDDKIEECLNMYNDKTHAIRDKSNFKDILKQWKCNSYYIYQDNNFTGYLIYNTKHDYINEIKTNNVLEVVSAYANFINRKFVNISVLNNDYDMQKIFKDYEKSKSYNRQLYSINNIKKVISVFLKYKLKNTNLSTGSISLKIDNEIIKITVSDNVIVEDSNDFDLELSKEQFMNIILNKKIKNNKLLSSWFYLDIDIYNNDLV